MVDNTSSLLSNETTGSVSNKEVLLLKVELEEVIESTESAGCTGYDEDGECSHGADEGE